MSSYTTDESQAPVYLPASLYKKIQDSQTLCVVLKQMDHNTILMNLV